MRPILISVVAGYLLGSIPWGYVLVRVFRGADVRTTGSGNIGATNVARTSPMLGITTLMLDAGKGLAAVLLVASLFPGMKIAGFVAAGAAICGHIFPVWLKFRGGKGVATGLGSFLLLTPKAVLAGIAVFLLLVAMVRFISLGSIVAALSLPAFAALLREARGDVEIGIVGTASLLIVAKHHQNIRRLLNRSEPRFQFTRK